MTKKTIIVDAEALDRLSMQLLRADGVINAIVNTFDRENPESSMPIRKLFEAICAVELFVTSARDDLIALEA